VATSSLTEKTTVYGGKDNLVAALKNVYERFNPTMITICSTCLSETIGDDVPAIIDEFLDQNPGVEIPIVSVRTPSYIGTHITGFDNFLKELAILVPAPRPKKKDAPTNGKVNLIPGWVNPGDVRELRALVDMMDVATTFITDYSDTLDGGYYTPRPRFPRGGTTVEDLRDSSSAMATIALQKHIGGEAAKIYQRRHNVPSQVLPMPIGLTNTDMLVEALAQISGKPVPEALEIDRARLLDAIVDTHMFNTGKKAAIYGDPDLVYGLVRLLAEMGMQPKFALTAVDSKPWAEDMLALADELNLDMEIMYKCDLHELHKRIKAAPVDVVLGHSKGKFLTDAEDVPLVRVGFPIEDRVGYHRRGIVGYRGAITLVDEITNAILANKMVVSSTVMEPKTMGPTSMPLEMMDIDDMDPDMAGGCGGGSCGGGALNGSEAAATNGAA
jgi:nitrogenase molybdenum-iron protein beta chain